MTIGETFKGQTYKDFIWDCLFFSSVQFSCLVMSNSLWPHGPQHARPPCPSPSPRVYPNSWPSSQWYLQPSHPLSSPSSPTPVPPSIRVFLKESILCMRWPKYWSLSFSISPSNKYSGLIFYRMDWFDLFTGQETLKSLLQHQGSKESIL